MSVVGDNIRALRTLYGDGRDITQGELAEIIGVTRETVNKWEAGTIGNVRTSNINRLREYYNLSVDDLRSESRGLYAKLRAKQSSLNTPSHALGSCREVPLVSLRVASSWEEAHDRIAVPAHALSHHPRLFAFEMPDDSMDTCLPIGAHVVADPDLQARSESIVVATGYASLSECVVRRIHFGVSKVMLSSESFQDAGDMVLKASDLHVLGVVVWYQAAKAFE